MKLCWDNIEELRYHKSSGKWYKGKHMYEYAESCAYCKKPFLKRCDSEDARYCSYSCSKLGGSRSIETRLKISKARLGKYKGKDNPNYGNKYSKATRLKISKALKGKLAGKKNPNYGAKTFTEDTIKKMSDAKKGLFIGEDNPNWRGGIAYLPYCSTWTKAFKKEIKERDGYQCQNPLCESPNSPLCVHHIDYNRSNCDPENLISLCMVCNSKANKDRQWHKAYYSAIMDKNKQQRMINVRRAYNE